MSANSPGGSVPPPPAGTQSEGPSSPSGTRILAGVPTNLVEWQGTSRYQVVRRLGQGGMGVVYEAIDRERSQRVALKTLIHFSPAALYRFKQEFRTLAGVQHPNLVRLYELIVTETDGVFFAMELVTGTDFLTYVQKPGVASVGHADSRVTGVALTRRDQPTEAMVDLEGSDPLVGPVLTTSPSDFDKLRPALRQLVEGVQALHGAGKLHRDIKPSNVLMAPDGRVVILDFGVATEFSRVTDANLSEEHEMVGTVRYMAPEQAFDGAPTPASDWYSVGVVLYEALVGQPPFMGSTIDVLSMKTLSDPLPPAERVGGVPADLDELCRALLEREPEKRPTGLEILRRLGVTRSVRPLASPLPAADPAKGTTLVGREAQMQALRDAFETVRSGRPVTVRVGGLSGMGKSAVAQHFLDGLVEGGEAVVLRGRAYERESLPYKAVDSVIDALSRYLMHLDEQGDAVELPSDVGALARVFPVLRRVPSIGDAAEEVVTDPQLVRRSAFGALRELLGSLAKRQPLVLYIDDAQWGDTDSAALLLELTRPPDAPPVLLVMTYREDDAKTSPFLTEMRIRWPSGAESRDIAVGPLALADAQRLALALLDAPAEVAQRTARAVARESRGNPFLIEELVRSNRGIAARSDGQTLAVLTLDQMVSQRLERLPDDARLLLEIVAVGGRPLPVSVVAQASGVGDAIDDVIALVSARRFVRGSLRDGKELVETSHDRFRETIVAQLTSETLRERHGRLAHALEAAPGVDAEAVAMHLLGAGQGERAAVYAEQAAEQAATKLAFDQAARLFRVTLDAIAPSSPDARRLHERLGKVLEWAGRAAEAAEAYQQAAEGAPPLERAELERAAAVELLACGKIDEGAVVLHRALGAVGLTAPRSTASALFWLILYRLRLSLWFLFGLRFKERAPNDVGREARSRVDAAHAAAVGFAITDVILGTCMAAWSLILALREGDRFQMMRAAMLQASNHAGMGGVERGFEGALINICERLAEKEADLDGKAFFRGTRGIGSYLRGRWKEALETLDSSISGVQIHSHKAGWQSNSNVFGCWALNFLGEHRELAQRHARLLADAEQRGDMYTSVQLRDGSLAIVWLVADDPDSARRNAHEAIALWPKNRYLLQHWHMLYGEGEIELYLGRGAEAYARVERDASALKKSFLLNVQHMRAQTAFLRGRSAIASIDAVPELRSERVAEARRLSHALEKEGMGWTAPFAAILKAGAANAEGDRSGAVSALRSAIDLARAADMSMYASAARYQLGLLLGGEEGRELVRHAEEAMTAQDVRRPDRLASTLVPGRWRAE